MLINRMVPFAKISSAQLRSYSIILTIIGLLSIAMGQIGARAQDPSYAASNAAFLSENGKNEGVETTASGLQFQTITEGQGPRPSSIDVALVGYRGMLIDGTVFDEAAQAPFPIGQLVPGFAEALQKMQIGGQYKIWIPSELAYGPDDETNPRTGEIAIPGGSTLVFEVTLIDYKTQAEVDAFREQAEAQQRANQAPPPAVKSFAEIEEILGFETIKAGQGKSPSENDQVLVSYRGMLADGTVFDQNAYATFPVNQVIPGFSVALQKMQMGGQYRINIPSEIGYGPNDRTNPRTGEVSIPGGSTLVFEVNLLHFISQAEITEFNNDGANQ